MNQLTLHIALPLMDEIDYISEFMEAINVQLYDNYCVYICVNQPDKYWLMPEKKTICSSNQKTIEFLKKQANSKVKIVDKSSKGFGWDEAKGGPGWARKVLMDQIVLTANAQDLIVSLDGDTVFEAGYFESVINTFAKNNKKYSALSVPYYHKLTSNNLIDRALLRYEIFMRYYLINMLRIKSPYAFTALGSAMVIPVWAYKAVSGIKPLKNGEDFYFLQKLRKYKPILTWNTERVYPAGRLSDRVDFGTGPALNSGITGNWKSYPIYDYVLFDQVKASFDLFPPLFTQHVETPMGDFLANQFKNNDIWSALRNNYTDISRFVHACECKVDGLRILQFLKASFDFKSGTDEQRLMNFLKTFHNSEIEKIKINLNTFSFAESSIEEINMLRDLLDRIENKMRKEHDNL